MQKPCQLKYRFGAPVFASEEQHVYSWSCTANYPNMKIATLTLSFALIFLKVCAARAKEKSISEKVAATAMTALWRDPARSQNGAPGRWTYEYGVVLKGIEGVWLSTGEGQYFAFIQKGMDSFVNADGTIRTYNSADYNLDNINCGKNLLLLYKVTGQDKYRKAA